MNQLRDFRCSRRWLDHLLCWDGQRAQQSPQFHRVTASLDDEVRKIILRPAVQSGILRGSHHGTILHICLCTTVEPVSHLDLILKTTAVAGNSNFISDSRATAAHLIHCEGNFRLKSKHETFFTSHVTFSFPLYFLTGSLGACRHLRAISKLQKRVNNNNSQAYYHYTESTTWGQSGEITTLSSPLHMNQLRYYFKEFQLMTTNVQQDATIHSLFYL
jgi:hypothetical protein